MRSILLHGARAHPQSDPIASIRHATQPVERAIEWALRQAIKR
ncbi:MAG: hypothetical protein ACLP8S_26785 [Solirubrobacteraceae bacterium]